jgi:UDP-N-acetylmuramate dehydrogenase
LEKNKDLRYANTFGLPAKATYFAAIKSDDQLRSTLAVVPDRPRLILGGGSNLLLPPSYPGLVLKNEIGGIRPVAETPQEVTLEIGGGVNWHELVLWSLRQGYGGLENLALIPGTVGAAPIQNIGAYGVELRDVFVELTAVELRNGQYHRFSRTDCQFGYRDSFFKQKENAGKFWLSKIKLRLTKEIHHLKLDYGAIRTQLAQRKRTKVTPSDVAAAVIEIRRAKLPDWRKLGNTGSFFKNPILSANDFSTLQQQQPDIPHYPLADGQIKVPAGWLIERSGWKGQRLGPVGCYAKQALVLVNHGEAQLADVLRLQAAIQADVRERFGVQLETEVTIVGKEKSSQK